MKRWPVPEPGSEPEPASDKPHRRYNPLTGEWVLVSPHRANRPWLGQVDATDAGVRLAHDPGCYLCAGNRRAEGAVNPDYAGVFVFDNDFPALMNAGARSEDARPLFQSEPATGLCRVVCFSPDHSKTLPELALSELRAVIDCWAEQTQELLQTYAYAQVFENRGAMMGCSNPHPHGQIWATDHVPDEIMREDANQRAWQENHQASMLVQLAEQEAGGPRVVVETLHWLAVVPWWASWPFETLLLPRFPAQRLNQLGDAERDNLAVALKALTTTYDNLFQTSFPYSMGWHFAPNAEENAHWQLHAHFYPPLLRSATVRKFMVGYEMLAEPQRDMTPEQAAARLREATGPHFRDTL